jgi:two-component system phosphate regulon response regulator OmpR
MTNPSSPSSKGISGSHIMVVDDDDRLRSLLSRYLKENGFRISVAKGSKEAEKLLELFTFDLLIIDVMMPHENGIDFTVRLRKNNNPVPVLILTAMGEPQNRITGLESGADDYLTKPFEPKELLLRIKSILKRTSSATAPRNISDKVIKFGSCEYHTDKEELLKNGEKILLTPSENDLLKLFISVKGRILSRDEIISNLGTDNNPRSADVQITRLRVKIEEDSKLPKYLKTIRGKGYILLTE